MIVKSGRLYLWQNKISDQELEIKVGTGSSSSEYVEIDQTALVSEVADVTVVVATEAAYTQWVADGLETNWDPLITNINDYIFENDRKIIIYAKIETEESFELGEIGLFVKTTTPGVDPDPDVITYTMISRNLLTKQYLSTTESKIIKYTINI